VVVGCAGSGKTTLARSIAALLDAPHIERDALGDDEAPGFAVLVAAAVEAAGRRWVFDGAPYNAEAVVYPYADALVALDYPRRIVWRRVAARSLRLWLTRRADGAHTSASRPGGGGRLPTRCAGPRRRTPRGTRRSLSSWRGQSLPTFSDSGSPLHARPRHGSPAYTAEPNGEDDLSPAAWYRLAVVAQIWQEGCRAGCR
jgi:hypothetical protein